MTQAKTQDMAVYPMTVAVRSESDGAAVHVVHLPYCDCADFTNRKGRLTGEGSYVSVCKHIREAIERVGGWHRAPEPAPLTYESLSRSQALILLTSACLAASAASDLVADARATGTGMLDITRGRVTVEWSASLPRRGYTVTLPAGQPLSLPAGWPSL
jgi:hypothetical protein